MTRGFGHPGRVAGRRVVGGLSDDDQTPWEGSCGPRCFRPGPWENWRSSPGVAPTEWEESDAPTASGEVMHEVVRPASLADTPGDRDLGVVDSGGVATPEAQSDLRARQTGPLDTKGES